MSINCTVSYREVVPKNINPEEWLEAEINTGTQSTLQDIKSLGKSGAFCYNSPDKSPQYRNRFIYWRTYQDILELSEVSLDITLLRNNLRLRFTDSAVLNVSLSEDDTSITLLVATVSSIHRIVFPLPTETSAAGSALDSQTQSIFFDVIAHLKERSMYHVLDGSVAINVPQLAVSHMCESGVEAYFAVDYQSKLMLHVMSCRTGNTVSHEIKEPNLMPRFLHNLKGALTGRGETVESVISLAFSQIEGSIYLLVLYRNNELRLWSTATLQSISTLNCASASGIQGLQNSLLRKIDEYNFCIFLSYEKNSDFVCCSIVSNLSESNTKTLSLVLQRRVCAHNMDLVDFHATQTHIWSLWCNASCEFNVSTLFIGARNALEWVSSALEPSPDRFCVTTEQGVDPKEAYCSYIFHPGRFDRNVIAKALFMFRRGNVLFDINQLTMNMLKEQVCQAVEDEIQNELKEYVVSDDEYLEIAVRLWDHFYSCCEQYHIKFSEPTGLAVLHSMETVCIVRRQSFALLRPCEMLEHLMLIGEHNDAVAKFVAPYCRNDETTAKAFVELMTVNNQLEKYLTDTIKMDLDKKFYQRDDNVVQNMLKQIISGNDSQYDGIALPTNYINDIHQKLLAIPNLDAAIDVLLDLLAIVDVEAFAEAKAGYVSGARFLQSTGALFGSDYGISILAETVKQIATIRFAVCRNLLIMQYIICNQAGLQNYSMVTNMNFLNSYYTLVWVAECPISLNTPVNFEPSIQRLTRAQLFTGYTRPYSSQIRLNSQTTLLSLFLQSKGLFSALSMLLRERKEGSQTKEASISQTLLEVVNFINQILWPEALNDLFIEWLFGTCHHIIIQDYVRILNGWCVEKKYSRSFMLAVSLLDCGEPDKALQIFKSVAESVVTESFLYEHILKNTPLYKKLSKLFNKDASSLATPEQHTQAVMHFYLKVIQLFEQHDAGDYVIELAQLAMGRLPKDDPQLPMFQSILFNNHLQLGHYEEAFHALVVNADVSRRKDCLRQLVIVLFQCKRFDLLMNLPYNFLQDEFEYIVESRARSLSIDQNEVYNFLYSFQATKGNMRKAGTVMYEQAMRLQVDSDAPNALDKRCSSLLVSINCLNLVDERYRWIAKPRIADENHALGMDQTGAEIVPDVVVLELKDIRRELLLAEALRELSHHRKDAHSYENASAEEIGYLLATCGLYTAALRLACGHEFSVLPIFESLTAACISTSEDKSNDAWSWLQNNDLADLTHRNSAADMAWSLLQKLVEDNEAVDSTNIRKSVVNRILTLNAFIPKWLYDSYKLSNSRELLYLLVKHNRLLEASELACEMISAMLGAGSEYFDFKHSLTVTNPQLAFPINTIDLLMHGLKLNGAQQTEYQLAHDELEEQVTRYVETLQRTTEDKIKLATLTERENRQQQRLA
ncbi:nuclear pore complex protein Nup160 homolog [Drosophila busckii]|uniref:nuclear pore complex protein Nup160 homolog n=1 Tax=Drosophila busckii TaxID=30019 RepID=UPI00083F4995|nr:nuclear pore complex protein Nup160 homolog [Drosophila busckii]